VLVVALSVDLVYLPSHKMHGSFRYLIVVLVVALSVDLVYLPSHKTLNGSRFARQSATGAW